MWKLAYHLLLFPIRFPDKALTGLTAQSTAFVYGIASGANVEVKEGPKVRNTFFTTLYINDRKAIGIADSCNGLELYVLYIGFLLCIPEKPSRKLLFITVGVLGIFVLNAFRCAGIAWLNLHYVSLVDFAHHYFFKMIIYALIFYTWVSFSRKYFNA